MIGGHDSVKCCNFFLREMNLKTETAHRELGYKAYEVEGDSKLLYKPFVNVYLGAAYLKWLSNYDQK